MPLLSVMYQGQAVPVHVVLNWVWVLRKEMCRLCRSAVDFRLFWVITACDQGPLLGGPNWGLVLFKANCRESLASSWRGRRLSAELVPTQRLGAPQRRLQGAGLATAAKQRRTWRQRAGRAGKGASGQAVRLDVEKRWPAWWISPTAASGGGGGRGRAESMGSNGCQSASRPGLGTLVSLSLMWGRDIGGGHCGGQ